MNCAARAAEALASGLDGKAIDACRRCAMDESMKNIEEAATP